MTRRELELIKQRFPLSAAVIKRSLDAETESSRPKPEQVVCHEPVAKKTGEAGYPDRVRVSITSFRIRLCDPDNLCPKYFVDCLRYAGLIKNDRPEDIVLEVRQQKVAHKSEEGTLVEIWHI